MKKIVLLTLLFFSGLVTIAQASQEKTAGDYLSQKGEVYFSFPTPEGKILLEIFNMVSVDNLYDNFVYAYSNDREFKEFLSLGIDYRVLPHPGDVETELNMLTWEELQTKDLVDTWDFYPTYGAYVNLMNSFEEDYPELCKIYNIGTTVLNRSLLFAKISANVNQRENEPRFMYTSTIHGDETTGFIMALRLIHHLLNNYGTNDEVTYLLDNMEIWICPNENPDGTYTNNDNTIAGATRYNANYVDLNRNYPNPVSNPGNLQPETQAMTAFVDTMNFVMSANLHGGVELVNYPFDSWTSTNPSNRHADHDWFYMISREFADTAQHYSPSGYMTGENNGVTHGGDWYVIYGGRQDYVTYYAHGRELTLEISNTKLLPANQLPAHWNYLNRSFFNHMHHALYGIRGTVKDADTGEPLIAKIEVLNHDQKNSEVYSSLPQGNFHRPILAGTYNLLVTADGYPPIELSGIHVENYQVIELEIELGGSLYAEFTAEPMIVPREGYVDFSDNSLGEVVSWEWEFEGGQPSVSTRQNPRSIIFADEGLHQASLTVFDGEDSDTRIKPGFIRVLPISENENHIMSNAIIATCGGYFYDSGGASGNYGNYEDYTMTFFPAIQGDLLKFTFSQFSIEANSNCNYDWLKIFNGPDTNAPLIGTYCGTNSPGEVTSSHATGTLTFQFHSDISMTGPGWAAEISCVNDKRRLYVETSGEGTFELSGTPLSGTNPYYFDFEQEISLTAIPAADHLVARWTINGETFEQETIQLQMNENIRAELVFLPFDGPVAVFEPLSLDFGTTTPDLPLEQELIISNAGNELLVVNFVEMIGDQVFFLEQITKGDYEINPGEDYHLPVLFIPEEEGFYSGQAVFNTNDPSLPEIKIALCGEAVLEAAILTSIIGNLDFGQVLIGESKTLVLSMENTGNVELMITGLSFADSVFSTAQVFPLNIEAEAEFELNIVFTPTDVDNYTDTLRFISNALNNDMVLIPLFGTGYSDVSIGDLTDRDFNVRIFPNPLSHNSLLELKLKVSGKVKVELFDLSGAQTHVLFENLLPVGTNYIGIGDLHNRLQKGMHFIRITYPGGINILRVVNIR